MRSALASLITVFTFSMSLTSPTCYVVPEGGAPTIDRTLQVNCLPFKDEDRLEVDSNEVKRQDESIIQVVGTNLASRNSYIKGNSRIRKAIDFRFELKIGDSEIANIDYTRPLTICSVFCDNSGKVVGHQKGVTILRVPSGNPTSVGVGSSLSIDDDVSFGAVGIAVLDGDFSSDKELRLISFFNAPISWTRKSSSR